MIHNQLDEGAKKAIYITPIISKEGCQPDLNLSPVDFSTSS